MQITLDPPPRFPAELDPTDRSVAVEMLIRFNNGNLRLGGQLEVTDDMVATARNLTCSGEGPVGGLLAALFASSIKQSEGQKRPLLEFTNSKMKLRDVRFHLDDRLRIEAEFGSDMK